jgi:hypothetical protein
LVLVLVAFGINALSSELGQIYKLCNNNNTYKELICSAVVCTSTEDWRCAMYSNGSFGKEERERDRMSK